MSVRIAPAACPSLRLLERRAGQPELVDLTKRKRYRIQLDAEVWIIEVAQCLQLAGDTDWHLMAARIEVRKIEDDGGPTIFARPLGHAGNVRIRTLARDQNHFGPDLLGDWA